MIACSHLMEGSVSLELIPPKRRGATPLNVYELSGSYPEILG